MEVQTHSKHQEDYANFSELRGDFRVGHIAGTERSDEDSRQQVPDNRRKFQFLCDETEPQGRR